MIWGLLEIVSIEECTNLLFAGLV